MSNINLLRSEKLDYINKKNSLSFPQNLILASDYPLTKLSQFIAKFLK